MRIFFMVNLRDGPFKGKFEETFPQRYQRYLLQTSQKLCFYSFLSSARMRLFTGAQMFALLLILCTLPTQAEGKTIPLICF